LPDVGSFALSGLQRALPDVVPYALSGL